MEKLIDMEKSIVILLEGHLWISNELSYLKVLTNNLSPFLTKKIIKMLIYMKLTFNTVNKIETNIDDISKVKGCLDYYGVTTGNMSEQTKTFIEYYGKLADETKGILSPQEQSIITIVNSLHI